MPNTPTGVYVVDFESRFDPFIDATAISKVWINGTLFFDLAVDGEANKHNTFDSVVSGAPEESGPRPGIPSVLAGGNSLGSDVEIAYMQTSIYELFG